MRYDKHTHGTAAAQVATSVLGFTGAFFFIVSSAYMERWYVPRRTLFWLALSDIGLASTFLFLSDLLLDPQLDGGKNDDGTQCYTFLLLLQYFMMSHVLCSLHVAIELLSILRGWQPSIRSFILCCSMCWLLPIAPATAMFAIGAYDQAFISNFCWVHTTMWWAWTSFFYAPVAAVLVINIGVYIYGHMKIKSLQKALDDNRVACRSDLDRQLKERMGRFVLAYAVLTIILLVFTYGFSSAASSITNPLYGLVDAFVYLWTPRVRERFLSSCQCSTAEDLGVNCAREESGTGSRRSSWSLRPSSCSLNPSWSLSARVPELRTSGGALVTIPLSDAQDL